MTEQMRSVPTQKRASATLDRVVSAAISVYNEVGRDRFTTGLVAKRAEVSIGTIYRYFSDRVALMDHINPNRDQTPITTEDSK